MMALKVFVLSLAFFLSSAVSTIASEIDENAIIFFYSPTCPHCQAEQAFLDELHKELPELQIKRFNITEAKSILLLDEILTSYEGADRYRGLVPLTFYKDSYFVGFDKGVRDRIYNKVMNIHTDGSPSFMLPFVGAVDPTSYSVPALSALLGLLDGFNVCSLGALMLVLGLVLKLRERRLVIMYGGMFIAITSLTYGLLIVLWHKLFTIVGPYVGTLELLVGLISLIGGIYFLYEYYGFQKHGLTCDAGTGKVVSKTSKLLESAFAGKGVLATLSAVILFAGVVTVVEFPCSAAIPVTFAGFLATLELSSWGYLGSIATFMLFYMLDEIVIFILAVISMKIWATSTRFVTWSTLCAGIILVLFGLYYLFGAVVMKTLHAPEREVGAVCDSTSTDLTSCDPSTI